MSGRLSGRGLPFRDLVPDEPGQVLRLREFRAAHPDVIIGDGGFGTFQGRIPEENGETVRTGHTLKELLDKLDEVTAGHQDQPGDPG